MVFLFLLHVGDGLWYDWFSMLSVTSRTDPACRPAAAGRYPDWQAVLADAVRDPGELCRLLDLPTRVGASAGRAQAGFPVFVPRTFLGRIRPGDPNDPLLLQVLPQEVERSHCEGFTGDPLGEAQATWAPGLLWKYQNRILMVATGACGVYCRFCFRRHFPFDNSPQGPRQWEPALERIAAEPSIHEVILSGGDPLVLNDERLEWLAGRLAQTPHLRRLRLHTRMPVMIPQRVNDELIGWLRGTRLTTIVVVHVNHPAEIDDAVAAALRRLVDAGVSVLNQSVLLGRVNDDVDVLVALCERLIDLGVMPYYLHQLDRVAGAAHFEVPESTGIKLIEQLRARLPGYAVPRYVRETPGEPNKVILA